jgi:hypothetical protein
METPNFIIYLTSGTALTTLIAFYFFGVWSRSYIFPSQTDMPLGKQFLASVPVGLLTMGVYAKTAVPALLDSPQHMVFDGAIMLGYAIIFGMLSRESLERLIKNTQPPVEAATAGLAPRG